MRSLLLIALPLFAGTLAEKDPARLEAAAVAIASSGNPAALADLGKHLRQTSFLERLDGPNSVVRLERVFRALAAKPSPAAAALCLPLFTDPAFSALPARLNLALAALSAVRPVSPQAAAVFRDTSRNGYLETNGPLLAANASPNAVAVLEELLADDALDAEQRMAVARRALVPNRLNPALLAMASRLVQNRRVSPAVQVAVLEGIFDYQPRPWFGTSPSAPVPPAWTSASPQARDALNSLARIALSRRDLTPSLRNAIAAIRK